MDNACYPVAMGTGLALPEKTARELDRLTADDPLLARCVSGWLLGCKTANTKRTYGRYMAAWLKFCHRYDIDPIRASRPEFDAWVRTIEVGRKPRSVATMMSTISSWYIWLVREKVRDDSPVDPRGRPSLPKVGATPAMSRDELVGFLATSVETESPTNHALLVLLANTGVRINEALSVDVTDLNFDSAHRVMRFVKKGGTEATTILAPPVVEALDVMLKGRRDGPLFSTRTGGRLNEPHAWRLVRRVARRAGIPSADSLSPHSLRATFITEARQAGASLESVQDAVGHADPRTTRIYDRKRNSLDNHPAYLMAAWLSPA